VLKDIERQKAHIAAFRGNPAISEASLDAALARLDDAFSQLNQQHGKPGHELLDSEWLMAVRSRAVIAAGTCSFDLPAYHAWQHQPASVRRADLEQWTRTLAPLARAIALLLHILRDSARPQKMMATGGQFQQMLPQGRTFQLLRLHIDGALNLMPEISGNRLMVSVRLLRHEADGKLHATREDTPFELALCA
jgi:cell division protein ZapD